MNQAPSTQDISNKISHYLRNDQEKWVLVTTFLEDYDNQSTRRCLQALRSVFNNDVAFYKIVDKLAGDTQILRNDPSYLRFMTDMWNNYLTPNENRNVGVNGQRFNFRLVLLNNLTKTRAVVGGSIGAIPVLSYMVNEYGWMASTSMAMGFIIAFATFAVWDWNFWYLEFLGLKCGASNDEINSLFVQLALKYHPDKGGSEEDWQKLQYSMNKIKLSRGEF